MGHTTKVPLNGHNLVVGHAQDVKSGTSPWSFISGHMTNRMPLCASQYWELASICGGALLIANCPLKTEDASISEISAMENILSFLEVSALSVIDTYLYGHGTVYPAYWLTVITLGGQVHVRWRVLLGFPLKPCRFAFLVPFEPKLGPRDRSLILGLYGSWRAIIHTASLCVFIIQGHP